MGATPDMGDNMHATCPRIAKPTDLHAPGAIDQLLAFHRQTFGGWTMEGEEDEAARAAAEASEREAAEKADAEAKAEEERVGYPSKTKVDDMTVEQQAAYHRHQARKHEDRYKDWQRTLGDKTPAQVKADQDELEKLRAAGRTDAENAVAEARKEGKAESDAHWGRQLVAAKFEGALSHLEADRIAKILDTLDLSKFITDNGSVDTDKVKSTAAALAPADKGAGDKKDRRDYGAGRRGPESGSGGTGGSAAGGIAARREALRAEREAKKTNSNV